MVATADDPVTRWIPVVVMEVVVVVVPVKESRVRGPLALAAPGAVM